LFVSIGPEKPLWGSGQLRYLFILFYFIYLNKSLSPLFKLQCQIDCTVNGGTQAMYPYLLLTETKTQERR